MLVHRPAIYEHAAALIGRSPDEVLADADLLYEAHYVAWQRYGLSHVVVAMDIYGADAGACSAVAGGPPAGLDDLARIPSDGFPAGPQENILSAALSLRREWPASVQVRIPVTAAFSLAAQLVGFEPLLIGLLDDPAGVAAALDALAEAQARYIQAIRKTGIGVTLFESAASPPLVRPGDFERIVRFRLARLMGAAREATGQPAELVLGGHTSPILRMLLDLAPSLVICDPGNDAAEYLAACRSLATGPVDLRVNLEPNLRLPEHRVRAHHRLESLARLARGSQPLYVATGVIPYDADPQTVLAFTELVEQVNPAV